MLVTGGSLNIRHLFIEEDLKLRLPLTADRLGFRFRRERRLGLERSDEVNQFEFEGRVAGPWWLSLVGYPTFHKSDAAVGFAAAWRRAEDRYVKFTATWPGFDTNYAFRNTSVNEGYTEAYRHHPAVGRLEAAWQGERTEAFLDASISRPWELEHEEFAPGSDHYVEQASSRELRAELRRRSGPWTWSAEAQYWRATADIDSLPPRAAEDRSSVQERGRVLLALDRGLDSGSSLRLQLAPAASRGSLGFPGDPSLNDGYRYRDRIASLGYLPRWSEALSGEFTYLLDLQSRDVTKGPSTTRIEQTQNRGTVALRWRMGPAAALAAVANIELDPDDGETFFSFDGGTLQFQAGLP